MFTLTEQQLLKLWESNGFNVPTDRWVFFGLRGCLPSNEYDHQFSHEHPLDLTEPDYFHPRCTLGQWAPGKGFALFPGSTVPHQKYVKRAKLKGGAGANQLLTGCYKDYRKGRHLARKPTGHEAFRQDNKLPVRRSDDDLDYELDDRVEYATPYDNLHAAYTQSVDTTNFASAGCQVVVGYPCCERLGNAPDTGAWKVFKDNAYAISQKSFHYVLLTGRDAKRVATTNSAPPRMRFGSTGPLVETLQQALKKKDCYEGDIDDDFGIRTLRGVLDFQTAHFGPQSDDGIVGPTTASALGIDWPQSAQAIPSFSFAAASLPAARQGITFNGRRALTPDGRHFATRHKRGLFTAGTTGIRDFVRANPGMFDGVSSSSLRVMEAVSDNEGKLEAINTWDSAFLSFGIFQWTVGTGRGRGELGALLARLKEEHGATFRHYFGQHGLDTVRLRTGPPSKPGIVPTSYLSLHGQELTSPDQKEQLRTPEWAYRFWLAGLDNNVRAVQIRQAISRVMTFYRSPRHRIGDHAIADYVSSECGVALLLDQHVNRPGHVPSTLAKAVEQIDAPQDPDTWNSQHEIDLLERYIELRANTSMTESDKRAQPIFDAVATGIISDERGSYLA